MEKRVLLAAILSIVVLFLYQQAAVRWFSPPSETQKQSAVEKSLPVKKTEDISTPIQSEKQI